MSLEKVEIETKGIIDASIVWLHGLGADGYDFLPIAEELGLQNTRFIFPHAPYRAVTINNGYEMRAWYDLLGLELNSPQDEHGIQETQKLVSEIVEQERKRGIAPERIILAGFSQGGAIALHTALRSPLRLGAVLALSTYLPLAHWLSEEISEYGTTIPILMAHGQSDSVITLETAVKSRSVLETLGCDVQWKDYPMAHGVCQDEIKDIKAFLQSILKL